MAETSRNGDGSSGGDSGEDAKPTVVFNLNALKEELKTEGQGLDAMELKFNDFSEESTDKPNDKKKDSASAEVTDLDAIFDRHISDEEGEDDKATSTSSLEMADGGQDISFDLSSSEDMAVEGSSPGISLDTGSESDKGGLDLGSSSLSEEEFSLDSGPGGASPAEPMAEMSGGNDSGELNLNVSTDMGNDLDLEVSGRSKNEEVTPTPSFDLGEPEPEADAGAINAAGSDLSFDTDFGLDGASNAAPEENLDFLATASGPPPQERPFEQTKTFEFNRPKLEDISSPGRNILQGPDAGLGAVDATGPGLIKDYLIPDGTEAPEKQTTSFTNRTSSNIAVKAAPPSEGTRSNVKIQRPPPQEEGPGDQSIRSSLLELSKANEDFMAYHENELVKLSAIIRNLREDRENLLNKIANLENEKTDYYQENVTIRAELDEVKIELELLRKRHGEEVENLKYQVRLGQGRKEILEEQNKKYQKEFERLQQKVKVDFRKIKEREKELEGQLELLKSDSQNQVSSRDAKILELKRQIDAMEFDMENMMLHDRKTKEMQRLLENKLDKIMKTLKAGLGFMEREDLDIENMELIKKVKF